MATLFNSRQKARTGRNINPHWSCGQHAGVPPVRENDEPDERSLGTLIEAEIIPRLLLAHGAGIGAGRAGAPIVEPHDGDEAGHSFCEERIERFATLAVEIEADHLLDEVEMLLEGGVGIDSIFVDLLAPAARKLGEFWEADACDFVDVTMGLWRLQEVMRELAMRAPPVSQALLQSPTALFAPLPGEQHGFGALMLQEVFSRNGWNSDVLLEPRKGDLLGAVAETGYDLLGLTISCDCPSDALSDLIAAIRGVSRNPSLQIFVGGNMINASPCIANEIGADGTAPDARSAVVLAEAKILGSRPFGQVTF